MKKSAKKFSWNVWIWNFNSDQLESYDVVPAFERALKSVKTKPKTRDEFDTFLRVEAQYMFWAKCEYEMVIHGWPAGKNDMKVDVFQQLNLNWDVFVNAFWEAYQKKGK